MPYTLGHVDHPSRLDLVFFVPGGDDEFSVHDDERLRLAVMRVRRRSGVRGHDRLHQGEFTIGVSVAFSSVVYVSPTR